MTPRRFESWPEARSWLDREGRNLALVLYQLHDYGCGLDADGGRCTCHPWYEFVPKTPEAIAEAKKQHELWLWRRSCG